MYLFIFFAGLVIGCFLNMVIKKVSNLVTYKKGIDKNFKVPISGNLKIDAKFTIRDIIVIIITVLLFLLSFLKIGFNLIFIEALLLTSILIVVSFIDIEHQIIPNKLIIFTLVIGIIFLPISSISFMNALIGMILGGGTLLLLALAPGVLGGGDIKLMFVLGIFLGARGVLFALFLAFVIASIISILLLIFKIKKRKDYIPFGPFLAIGSFIAFHFITNISL
jgi:leader peptidase (prepilin peptidase)/N-methyltransferase